MITCDAKALGLILSAVSDEIFPRITNRETAKATWNTLKQKYRRDSQVRAMKLQSIRWDFEYVRMKSDESLSAYLTRLFGLLNQIKMYAEELSNNRIVKKLLISPTYMYNNIVFVIEETKNLSEIDILRLVLHWKGFKKKAY